MYIRSLALTLLIITSPAIGFAQNINRIHSTDGVFCRIINRANLSTRCVGDTFKKRDQHDITRINADQLTDIHKGKILLIGPNPPYIQKDYNSQNREVKSELKDRYIYVISSELPDETIQVLAKAISEAHKIWPDGDYAKFYFEKEGISSGTLLNFFHPAAIKTYRETGVLKNKDSEAHDGTDSD